MDYTQVTAVKPRFFALFVALGALSACASTTVVEPFYRPAGAQVEYVFLSPDADFSVYRRLQLTPLEIYYPDDVPQPPQTDLDRLRAYFREAFLSVLGNDYAITSEAAADALRVQAQIIDLKLTGANGSYEPSQRLRQLVSNGELTFLMELQDSVTGRTLARAGDTTRATGAEQVDEDASWDSVQTAAEHWATLFREFLDANLGSNAPN